MFKSVFALALAGSALAVAAPASAQYYPQAPYGYGNGYGNGYGYNGYGNNNWAGVRDLQRRIYNVRRSLVRVRPDQAYRLNAEANNLQRRLQIAARSGLNPYEARDLDARVNQLERRVGWAVAHGGYRSNGYDGRDGSYGTYDDSE